MKKPKAEKVAEAAVRTTIAFIEGVISQATQTQHSFDVADDVVAELVKKSMEGLK